MDKFPILAKPSGITLEQHTSDVMSEAMAICASIPATEMKYKRLIGKSLKERLVVVAKYHDLGKKFAKKWQNACIQDYEKYQQWRNLNKNKSFKEYRHQCSHEAGSCLRQASVRHEFYSLLKCESDKFPLSLMTAIAAHHAKLSFKYSEKWKDQGFEHLWKEFKRESYKLSETNDLDKICRQLFEYDGLRGLLRLVDQRASAKEDSEYVPAIKSFDYKFPFIEKRGIQNLIEQNWDKDLLLVRAPTGAGKTDAALLWAKHQIECGKADRAVFAMPTRFTANALAISTSNTLSDTGLYHSSAWFKKYSDVKHKAINMSMALAQHKMARLLATSLTVCTIDHLLISLTQTREEHHLINFNMANSCLIIDEADFYDDFSLANILFLLKVLHKWQVPVLIMSASLPESALSLYKSTGYNADRILEDSNNYDNLRKRVAIRKIREYEALDDIADEIHLCIKKGNGIIYLNTVDKAVACYHYVKGLVEREGKTIPVILYHSRFTNEDKTKKENELIAALGHKAWSDGSAKGIAILTQIGEISINISADVMISEICPIDRLTQRIGRLCRFSENIGELFVVIPTKEMSVYPAPYGSFDRKNRAWIPCQSFVRTLECLKPGTYSSADLTNLLNKVYNCQQTFSVKATDNADQLELSFKTNWLLNPIGTTTENDEETNLWRSRDIEPLDFVFVTPPASNHFFSYSEYLEYELTESLSLPIYLITKARKMNRIDTMTITIGDSETRNIAVIRQGFYNDEFGIDLTETDNFL